MGSLNIGYLKQMFEHKSYILFKIFFLVIPIMIFLNHLVSTNVTFSSDNEIEVLGSATVLSTSNHIYFTSDVYGANVVISVPDPENDNRREITGYAWSEDLGWIRFAPEEGQTDGVFVDYDTGVVTGSAYVLNTEQKLLFHENDNSVVVDTITGEFEGYIWSEDLGWVDLGNNQVYVKDDSAPEGSIEINSGLECTSSNDVNLKMSASDSDQFPSSGVSQMMICNQADFSGCDWEEYMEEKEWSLIDGDGEKTVYIKFSDVQGNESISYSDSIILDSSTYSISFNGNGNTGGSVPVSLTQTCCEEITLPSNSGSLSRTGYSFIGWNTEADGSGISYSPNSSYVTPIGNVTLFARWAINTYSISFNSNSSNGGIVPSPITGQFNSQVTLPGNVGNLAKVGYSLTGWNTQANGNGTFYTPGSKFNIPATNTTLFAQWSINQYALLFDGNGSTSGTAPQTITQNFATQVVIPNNTGMLTRVGHVFASWNTGTDGSGITYAPGDIFIFSANSMILYAQWRPVTTSPSTTTTPPITQESVVKEVEKDVDKKVQEKITEEEILLVKRILQEVKEYEVPINNKEGVTVAMGNQQIETRTRSAVHVYRNKNLNIEVPVGTLLSSSTASVNMVYAVLGEDVYRMELNSLGDKYVAQLRSGSETGKSYIALLALFEDGTVNKSTLEIVIDPYGYVYSLNGDGNQVRIKGATVTLYRVQEEDKSLYVSLEQDNPQNTNEEGEYSFLVEPGTYVLLVEADGYKEHDSGEFVVEKDIVEMNIQLERESKISEYTVYALILLILGLLSLLVLRKKR